MAGTIKIPLIETNGLQTNFGVNFWLAKAELDAMFNRHCLPVSTGTAALQLAAQITFQRHSRIACPEFTMVATLQAIVAAGCTPVIMACDGTTGLMNPKLLEQQHSWGVIQGAVIVSPFGASFDHTAYEACGMPIVYDFAGAFPMMPATRHPVVFSCHATKNISTREGGIACFANSQDCESARRMSCFALDGNRMPASVWSGNHKMDEHRCGMLLDALKDGMFGIHARIANKRRLLRKYASTHATPLPGLLDGFPSLCVLKVQDAQRLEAFGLLDGIIFKRYYHPLLSDCAFDCKVKTYGETDKSLREYIAFPSDANDEQVDWVNDCVERCFS